MSQQDKNQKPKKQLKEIAALTGIAIQMGLTIYLFVIFGKWLDNKVDKSEKTFLVIFTLTGVAFSLYAVLQQIKKLNS
ncbi:AtpZ/AtpI family protein [Hyunsoonleella ulvae]|uniref:AtpZ/AtpI family protein n=2 Tax=Flavobacteriaceae TaxID=49546 RepID=UPI00293D74C7|nr:AtpZ/AtpI family protein [Hyunsoonleella ulvae]